MVFRTTFHNDVATPIPQDIDPKELISIVHDHSFLITMSPIVTRHEIRERDPSSGKIKYDVWENINILPFGLWVYELQFMAAFTDKRDGVVSYIEAPMGFTSQANYTIKSGERWDGEGGGWILEEAIESSCSAIFKPFIEATMVPVRKKMHQQMIEQVRTRVQRRSGSTAADRPPGNWI